MLFKSKAETLNYLLGKKIKGIIIPQIYIFKISSYKKNPKKILDLISYKFKDLVAIRSTSEEEDSTISSHAGEFKSILNVNPKDKLSLIKAIDDVFNSYKKKKPDQKIFIQYMVKDVKISGVAISCDITNYCSNYIVCNYSIGKNTTIVTSGEGQIKNFYYFKGAPLKHIPLIPKSIIQSLNTLSNTVNREFIDIEFAIDKKNKFHLLQLRPVAFNKLQKIKYIEPNSLLKLEKKILKLQKPHPNLYGDTTFFGVMPDWNPAEMIGLKPRNFAKSIYRELITDKIWSIQRTNYGYKDVMNNQLMSSFLGTPYIDIRTDFNSWIPKSLSNKTSTKLMKYYLNKMKSNIDLHDNVEFEILFTCFNFNKNKTLKILKKNNFSNKEINEIINSLKELTLDSIKKYDYEISKINKLKKHQLSIENSNMYELDKIYWHISYCKDYGTLPFAGLARIAFVAYDILNSLYENDYITSVQKQNFLQSLKTISKKIDTDFNSLNKKSFIKRHGHLRPNTYEITSLNYEEGYHYYYGSTKKTSKQKNKNKSLRLTHDQKEEINKYLKKNMINLNVDELFNFIKKAIESREYSKYIFTKSIDLVFKNVIKLGKRLNISREDLSFIEIGDILKLYYSLNSSDISNELKEIIRKNKKEYDLNSPVNLPNTIIKPQDIYFYSDNSTKGNFFGTENTYGEIINLSESDIQNLREVKIDGKIICIHNADPGFDFIFSKNILGLITCYGGSNSHMAIRCSEKNMTSIIGVGEYNFKKIVNSRRINIEPFSKRYFLV